MYEWILDNYVNTTVVRDIGKNRVLNVLIQTYASSCSKVMLLIYTKLKASSQCTLNTTTLTFHTSLSLPTTIPQYSKSSLDSVKFRQAI